MTRMKRKDLLNAPDEFVTTTSTVLTWIKENPQRFAIGVIIIIALVVGGYGFYYWKTSKELDGMHAYMQAAGNSQLTLQVAQEYSDTKAGKLSKLRLARMSYDQGNQKMAISYAGEFIDSWGQKDIFHWQAVLIMATAYMQQKEMAKSLPLLDDCIENAPKGIRDQALFLKAGAQVAMGKSNEAKQTLSKVSESYRDIAKILLASKPVSSQEKINAE